MDTYSSAESSSSEADCPALNEDVSAQGPGAAAQDRFDCPAMGGRDARAKLRLIPRPMPAQHFGQFDHGGSNRLALQRVVQGLESREIEG